MKLNLILGMAISLLFVFTQQTIIIAKTPQSHIKLLSSEGISEADIEDTARKITVRVFGKKKYNDDSSYSGSGVIIDRKLVESTSNNYLYLILTNHHIIQDSDSIDIGTHDAEIHTAFPLDEANKKFISDDKSQMIDLALIWFASPINYEIAALGDSSSISQKLNQPVTTTYVSGFPCQQDQCEFKLTKGSGFLWHYPLQKGYQIGYTNEAISGISGGSVLNNRKELIGVQGEGKDPPLKRKYNPQNPNLPKPSPEIKKFMTLLAWGIPINRYKTLFPNHPIEEAENDYNKQSPSLFINLSSSSSSIPKEYLELIVVFSIILIELLFFLIFVKIVSVQIQTSILKLFEKSNIKK